MAADGHATDKDVVVLRLRFNQVFVGLLVLAILSAFVLPADLTNRLRGLQGLFAPVGTPQSIIDKLHTELSAVLAMPDVAQKLLNTGSGEPNITTAEELAGMIRRDYESYGKVIKETGVKIDD